MSVQEYIEVFQTIILKTGFMHLTWGHIVMWTIGLLFMYLGVAKKYEPLLLLPIGFGIFLVNFPLTPLMGSNPDLGHEHLFQIFHHYGIQWEVIPCVIFLGLGAMTDFGPLIANPKTLLVGAGAQLGVFITFSATLVFGFTWREAASVAIIGGADGPTTIYLTNALAPHLVGPNALAAYSYMAMVPIIQPPLMRLFTNQRERQIVMRQLRPVSQKEKMLFPLLAAAMIALMIPPIMPLMGMLMLGNFMRESGVVRRLSDTAQGSLMNIVTIFLGLSVGATMSAETFLTTKPLVIFTFGLLDFSVCTVGGIWTVKIMNLFLKEKLNPLIGAAGVSAVPMASRVAQMVGLEENLENHLLFHALGPNLAGVIGTAAAAGLFIAMFA